MATILHMNCTPADGRELLNVFVYLAGCFDGWRIILVSGGS